MYLLSFESVCPVESETYYFCGERERDNDRTHYWRRKCAGIKMTLLYRHNREIRRDFFLSQHDTRAKTLDRSVVDPAAVYKRAANKIAS